tara:strand:+ start:412 stop:1242 length:831 start_codon:yes stop_codon:yes gene_type:complete
MSGGGGKGGSKTTETTIPEWVRAPADRNLQRAEAVQQLEYMPYFGAQVAALNENQTNAMQNNANAASAFGLLAPTDVMADMPTPTTYANGMKGYSSMPIYDQAMKELTASNPENMDAYDALFGGRTTFGLTGGGGSTSNSRFSGSASPSTPSTPGSTFTPNYDTSTWSQKQQDSHNAQINPNSTINTLDASYALDKNGLIGGNKGSGTDYKAIVAANKQAEMKKAMSSYQPRTSSSPSNSPGHPSNAGKSYSAPKPKTTYKSKGGTYNAYRHVGGR